MRRKQTAKQPNSQTAKQPYARSAPSSPPPLAPPAKALGAKGCQAVVSSSLSANIKIKSRFVWVGTMLTRVAMEFDGVSVSSSGYNRVVDYEHEHEHEHGEEPEPRDADEGLADRG